jgi:beta-galactosidase
MVYICVSARTGRRMRGFRGEESWNWPDNATVNVICYTNCPEVSLTLNDKPLGTKNLSDARAGVLTWEVQYEPGTLSASGLNNGDKVCEFALRTAGPASRIELSPDVTQIRADGRDICHLKFEIIDDKGIRVPDADNEVTFEVDGPADIIGIENGNLNSIEDPKDNVHKAYHGHGLAILQSETSPGRITVTAGSPGLEPAAITIESR